MPTTPPEAHQHRETAESFGAEAERYDRARPRYPDALVQRILAASPGTHILDVGCGTGIVARQFQAAGCTVLGVEPDARMAEFARHTGVETEVATFEAWNPAGRTFDAVVAGMTWHWVDPVEGAAKAAQLLLPGGRLALFWYVFEAPPDLGEAFTTVARRVLPDLPMLHNPMPGVDAYSAFFTKATDGINQTGAFDEPEQWRYDHERRYTRDEWLDLVPTFGGHSRLTAKQQRDLLAGVGEAIDAAGGSFIVSYATVAVTTTRAAP